MQVYDETTSAAAVQWMAVVREHLEHLDAVTYLQGFLTSTCTATAQLLVWLHETMQSVLEHSPDSPAAQQLANNATLLYFVLLKDQLNRVCAAAGIATQPLSIIRNTHVRACCRLPWNPSCHIGGAIFARRRQQPGSPSGCPARRCSVPGHCLHMARLCARPRPRHPRLLPDVAGLRGRARVPGIPAHHRPRRYLPRRAAACAVCSQGMPTMRLTSVAQTSSTGPAADVAAPQSMAQDEPVTVGGHRACAQCPRDHARDPALLCTRPHEARLALHAGTALAQRPRGGARRGHVLCAGRPGGTRSEALSRTPVQPWSAALCRAARAGLGAGRMHRRRVLRGRRGRHCYTN